MDIIVRSLGFTAGDELEVFIREKLEKFDKETNIIRANVTLYTESQSNPNCNYCEMRLEVPGNDLFVKRNSDSFEKAIVDAINTLQQNLHKAKEKHLDRNHGNLS
jgi:putative sigma-54 modulation protein